MPYKDVTDLPQAVRESLPRHGQEIYKEAFNSAWNQYGQDEIRASKVAWSAVGKKFKKTNKGWVEAMQTQNIEMKKSVKKQQPKEKVGKVMPMVVEETALKPAVKKPAAKKPAAKKPAAKKPAAKKPAAKKPAAKKPAKKKVAKKATAKKSVAKKSAVKKSVKRKTTAKKSTAKKSVMKKTKRSAPKRAAAKRRK